MTDGPQSTGLVALADRIELWPIDRLRPYERNPRTHSEAQVDQIAASLVALPLPLDRKWLQEPRKPSRWPPVDDVLDDVRREQDEAHRRS
jgi:hypothetical protein